VRNVLIAAEKIKMHFLCSMPFFFSKIYKGKSIPVWAWTGPLQGVEAPRFQDSRHMKVVMLLVLPTGRL